MLSFCDFARGIDSVEGRGSDTSGIAGSFTARIEIRCANGLKRLRIPGNAYRTATAAFYTQDNGIVGQESRVLAVKISKTLL